MNAANENEYRIGIYEGWDMDRWVLLASIRAADDAAANAYAEAHFSEHEWYIFDADGNDING